MHLTYHVFTLIATLAAYQPAPAADDTLQKITLGVAIANLVLTGIYVFLTLRIANGTNRSVRVTEASLKLAREQMEKNEQQSKDALKTSKEQNQDAINVVREQIQASEKQSKEAIDAIHEQIDASAKQSREAIQNQYKPVILPTTDPRTATTDTLLMDLENVGLGVAMSVWGTLGIKDRPQLYSSLFARFLVPSLAAKVYFGKVGLQFPYSSFDKYTLIPIDDAGISYDIRLALTYNDVFNNKYLVIWDHAEGYGWKQVILKQVDETMDEVAAHISVLKGIHDHVAEEIKP